MGAVGVVGALATGVAVAPIAVPMAATGLVIGAAVGCLRRPDSRRTSNTTSTQTTSTTTPTRVRSTTTPSHPTPSSSTPSSPVVSVGPPDPSSFSSPSVPTVDIEPPRLAAAHDCSDLIKNHVNANAILDQLKTERKKLQKIARGYSLGRLTSTAALQEISRIQKYCSNIRNLVSLAGNEWWKLLPCNPPGDRAKTIAEQHDHSQHSADHLATDIQAAFTAAGWPLPVGMSARVKAAKYIYQYVIDNGQKASNASSHWWRKSTFIFPDVTAVSGLTTINLAGRLVITIPLAVAHPSNPNGTAFIG